jgi:hypothetical protein
MVGGCKIRLQRVLQSRWLSHYSHLTACNIVVHYCSKVKWSLCTVNRNYWRNFRTDGFAKPQRIFCKIWHIPCHSCDKRVTWRVPGYSTSKRSLVTFRVATYPMRACLCRSVLWERRAACYLRDFRLPPSYTWGLPFFWDVTPHDILEDRRTQYSYIICWRPSCVARNYPSSLHTPHTARNWFFTRSVCSWNRLICFFTFCA